MSQTAKELLKQAMKLPEAERMALAAELRESVEEPTAAAIECFGSREAAIDWTQELDRRDQALREGKMRLLSHEEVRANVRKILGP